ncbi:alpha/beta hydrolase [Lunatibacter salilacus]|uniref:alpha/beta hydrolase n=1 Tax=Lunatibacter salilacus TaxID=2483804 RepID=UPI00131D8F93|nr:dienelactone hydrolase family protein [Lunatibacter salilacus]
MINVLEKGKSLDAAKKVAIMVHGRGSNGSQIVSLADHLNLDGFALLAPQASGNTWYPYSFMAAQENNQPALDKALAQLQALVQHCFDNGKTTDQLYLIGFSQGACLALEYAARNPNKYGGIIAFTGGLIGENLDLNLYKGDFEKTPFFIGASHQDIHVPLHRVKASEEILKEMGAKVKTLIFPDTYHTIREEEIEWVNQHILF